MITEPGNFIDNMRMLAAVSSESLTLAHGLRKLETLEIPTQHDGVDEARKILRWLKNLQSTGGDMEQWLRIGQLPEQLAKADMLKRLTSIYARQLKITALQNPTITSHYIIENANHAAGSLSLSVALHALDILPAGNAQAAALDKALDGIPEQWEHRQTQPVEQLVENIETALAHLTDKPINERSPVDRLVEISNKILQTAKKLRSIETLEEPAREESIELAREILRKLRGMVFSDKPVIEALDAGKPEEKLAFSQRIAALIESYKNLLSEAALFNPNIFSDARIKAANDAVGKLTHSIKLLAAKELPTSAAATQQISADVSQMPEEWKDLHDRTVDRLLKNMEDGLERAVDDIMVAQEEQAEQQEQAEQHASVEMAIAHSTHSRRKRRRRHHGGGGSGLTKSAARVNAGDRDGDGVRDIYQGKGIAFQNMKEIAQIGDSLRSLNSQALQLPGAAAIVAASNIAPDDKGFTERSKDQQTNPRNRNKPQIGG